LKSNTGFRPGGIIPAVITPLTQDGKINENALRKLIGYLIAEGVHGLFVSGTTGEFYGLTPEEKKEIFNITMDEARGRVPVYAGTNGITTRETILLTHLAEICNVDAVSVLTPMFLAPDQEQLFNHYRTIAENTGLPVVLYNNPPKTGVSLNPLTVSRLAAIPNIAGIKDSSGDMTITAEYIRLTKGRDDFSVLVGRDTLIYGALCYGAAGSIAACANVAPGLCVEIYEKYMTGDLKGSLDAQFALAPLRIAFSLGTFPAVIKESLNLLGIDAGPCMEPAGPLKDEERSVLKKVLEEMGLMR
jgi:4-hydroxy-tetrahydrodipicolinate synthase